MSDTTLSLPRLDWDAITFVHLYYDGPLVGLCTFEGRTHYFEVVEDAEFGERLDVYPLTDDEVAREERLKALFELHVGTYWSFDRPREERHIVDCEGSTGYREAALAAYPDLDEERDRTRYASRTPVAFIASE